MSAEFGPFVDDNTSAEQIERLFEQQAQRNGGDENPANKTVAADARLMAELCKHEVCLDKVCMLVQQRAFAQIFEAPHPLRAGLSVCIVKLCSKEHAITT